MSSEWKYKSAFSITICFIGLLCLMSPAQAHDSSADDVHTEKHAEKHAKHNEKAHGKHKKAYHHSFADIEKWVKKFDDPERDKWQKPDEVIRDLQIGEKDKLIDIGAGTGYFSLRIAKAYPQATIYAADVESSMVNYLNKQSKEKSLPNHIGIKIPTNKAKFPGKVNLVLVVDTYHHIDNRIFYFRALKNKLLPGGRVAIIDFTKESPEGPPVSHRFSKEELVKEMSEAGYKLSRETSLPYQYFLIFETEEKH